MDKCRYGLLDKALRFIYQRDGCLCDEDFLLNNRIRNEDLSILVTDGLVKKEKNDLFTNRFDYSITDKDIKHLCLGGYLGLKKDMDRENRKNYFRELSIGVIGGG
ncbi:hypothetical protein [Parabacteroides sp. AM08-6]|uniref:hypothetical protein n=1 Tax=Parabacteroides sp. AM08-6 TaxID=2292053 RepID=UPI000EFFC637|nr:hypothetical protein [Parabacteroides sp. AM08-6]RHJ76381.1 hypothetical protein DW103_16835 [Parabacteroides sp. AM08-6]